jgi:hypothetical protein
VGEKGILEEIRRGREGRRKRRRRRAMMAGVAS